MFLWSKFFFGLRVSQRHARSLKQLASGKLKVQLDSDGNEEEEGETHAERLERIRSIAEVILLQFLGLFLNRNFRFSLCILVCFQTLLCKFVHARKI